MRLRPLLWLDCTAAALAGTVVLALNDALAPVFGLPRALVVFIALVNLAYGLFSFSLARPRAPPPGRVNALVAANLSWAGVCLVMAWYFSGPGSWLGMGYMLAEAVFVAVLATLEAKARGRGGV